MAKELIVYVSLEKERRARMIVGRKGVHNRPKHQGEVPAMEEVAYARVIAESPNLEGEDLVRAVYEKLDGLVLTSTKAAQELHIRERIKKQNA